MQIQSSRPIIRLWYWKRVTLRWIIAPNCRHTRASFQRAHVRARWMRKFVTSARFAWLNCHVCRSSVRVVSSMRVRVLACVFEVTCDIDSNVGVKRKGKEKIERKRKRGKSLVTLLVVFVMSVRMWEVSWKISDTRRNIRHTRWLWNAITLHFYEAADWELGALLFFHFEFAFHNFRNIDATKISCRFDDYIFYKGSSIRIKEKKLMQNLFHL